jgi:predicted nucleic acid-binding protein
MAVVFDANILIDLFNEKLKGDRRIKLDFLVKSLEKSRTKILIPTPSLTELLVGADKARSSYFQKINSTPVFAVEPFDKRAALECSILLEAAWSKSDQRKISHSKFKFDWQIVSIAASRNATAIYSDDGDIERAARHASIPVYKTSDLPLPESARQGEIIFNPHPDQE